MEYVEQVEEVKRGRGRPRKERIIGDEPTVSKKRGRPRKVIDVQEIREKQKPGPKTSLSSAQDYFTKYYRENYQGIYVTCPVCGNPNVNVSKIHRHVKTRKCMLDDMCNKYHTYSD
jgi:hypothetical protein